MMCPVMIDLQLQSEVELYCSHITSSLFVGSVIVSKNTLWTELEERIAVIFLNHMSEVSLGLQTKKTCHSDALNPLNLGISLSSIKYYSIGDFTCFKIVFDIMFCYILYIYVYVMMLLFHVEEQTNLWLLLSVRCNSSIGQIIKSVCLCVSQ